SRYDDREYIQTNLVEAYEQLMAFVARSLPDKFYMEGDQRVSLRTKIFREVVANMIVHREYTNAHPCSFIIYSDRVETENANNPHGDGPIDPDNFAPFPKNPAIAKFFIQLGRVDELGSGVMNVNRLIKEYSDKSKVQFIEGVTFKTIIPVSANATEGATEGAVEGAIKNVVTAASKENLTESVLLRLTEIVSFIYLNKGTKVFNLLTRFNVSERTIKNDLKLLIDAGLIIYIGSKKAGSYVLSKTMLDRLNE
ncbi:MAG: HTH domain-containing protein, partial [Bacteroidales bacterium]